MRLLEILRNLDPPKKASINFSIFSSLISDSVWQNILKFLSAAILPLLVVLANWKDDNIRNTVIGSVALALIFGVIGILIPIIYSLWIHFLLMPAIELLALTPFMIRDSIRKKVL